MHSVHLQMNDVMTWKHFPRYCPYMRGIHRWTVDYIHENPAIRSFGIFFEVNLNKQSIYRWYGTPWHTCDIRLKIPWWRHCIETLSALLSICEGNQPVTSAFPPQRECNVQLCCFPCCDPEQAVRLIIQCQWFETSWGSCDIIVMY